MCRAAAGSSVDPATGAGCVTVAGLQIGAADAVGHQAPMGIAGAPSSGTCKPGTVTGETATQSPSATNAAAKPGASRSPDGSTFCAKITAAIAAIQVRLMTPRANSATISPQQ